MMISLPELILELRELWTQISQYLNRDSLCHCSPLLWARQSVTPHPPPTTFFQILNLSFFQDFPEIHLTLTEKAPGRFELCNHFITVYTIQMHFLPLKMRVRSRLLVIYTDARQNHQLSSFQKAKYHCVISPFRSVCAGGTSGSYWLLCVLNVENDGYSHLSLLPHGSHKWSTHHQCANSMGSTDVQVKWNPKRPLLKFPPLNKVSYGIL